LASHKEWGGEGFPLQFLPQAADFHWYIKIILTREEYDFWQAIMGGRGEGFPLQFLSQAVDFHWYIKVVFDTGRM